MIGIDIHSPRHLLNTLNILEPRFFIARNRTGLFTGIVVKTCENEIVVFSNDYINGMDAELDFDFSDYPKLEYLTNKYKNIFVLTNDILSYYRIFRIVMFHKLFLMPKDYKEKYNIFIKENKKIIDKACKKYDKGYEEMSDSFVYFYNLCNGSRNFFEWSSMLFCNDNFIYSNFEYIMNWNDKYGYLANKLQLNTITAYNKIHLIYQLIDEMIEIRKEKIVNDTINKFNTTQKKIIKSKQLSLHNVKTLINFSKLSEKKQRNFIRKVSTINSFDDIMDNMVFVSKVRFEWKKESLFKYINDNSSINADIVFDNDNIVLVRVNDYETARLLGKSTNWCISKDKRYWNDYVEFDMYAKQYIIFDFSLDEDNDFSTIGFTLTDNGDIIHAHSYTNNNLLMEEDEYYEYSTKYLDFYSNNKILYNIYYILNKNHIDLNALYGDNKNKWDRKEFYKKLYDCVDPNNCDILVDTNDKVIVIVNDIGIKYFFENKVNFCFSEESIFLVADFTKDKYDNNRIIFGIFNINSDTHKSSIYPLFNLKMKSLNEIFDEILEENGLPYDIIKRVDTPLNRFKSYLEEMYIPGIKRLINNEDIKHNIKRVNFIDPLKFTVSELESETLLDVIYDNGYILDEVLLENDKTKFLTSITTHLYELVDSIKRRKIDFNYDSKTIQDVYEGRCENSFICTFVRLADILKKILNKEKPTRAFLTLAIKRCKEAGNDNCSTFIMNLLMPHIKMNSNNTNAKLFISVAYKLNLENVIEKLENKSIRSKEIRNLINETKQGDKQFIKIKNSIIKDLETIEDEFYLPF